MIGDKSDIQLKTGLEMVGKATMNIREWTGKFAEEQHKHQYPEIEEEKGKYTGMFTKNLEKFSSSLTQCSLCLTEKPRAQFHFMCKCKHSYCYNCLNTYAISRIQDSSPVICPQQDCCETMPLSSKIYKYLPDSVKIKYLNNRHAWKNKNMKQTCPRCLCDKHAGQCMFEIKPQKIQHAYHYRQCSKCKTEVNLTEGTKKIKCEKCGHQFCYFCGSSWTDSKTNKKHECGNLQQVDKLQKQFQNTSTVTCDNCAQCCCLCECGDCICDCCDLDCCRRCDEDLCCEICFYMDCDQCSPGCALWNLLSVPIRIVISVVFLALLFMYLGMLLIIPFTILCGLLMFSYVCGVCLIMENCQNCCVRILLILFFPITALCIGISMIPDACQKIFEVYAHALEGYCSGVADIWIECSPKHCCTDSYY